MSRASRSKPALTPLPAELHDAAPRFIEWLETRQRELSGRRGAATVATAYGIVASVIGNEIGTNPFGDTEH